MTNGTSFNLTQGDFLYMTKNAGFHHKHITSKPWTFLVVFLVVFFVVSVVLFAIDFVPESPTSTNTSQVAQASTVTLEVSNPISGMNIPSSESRTAAPVSYQTSSVSNMPVRITIPKVGIDTPVNNPTALSVTALDSALLKGAVRYPDSGLLGENAPVFIFGHQSYLPVVKNPAFKAFNGLQNVRVGDDVIVSSATMNYRYRVVSVDYVDAGDAEVQVGGNSRTLTLVTCDSFGKQKTKRYVVKAEFVSEEAITTRS